MSGKPYPSLPCLSPSEWRPDGTGGLHGGRGRGGNWACQGDGPGGGEPSVGGQQRRRTDHDDRQNPTAGGASGSPRYMTRSSGNSPHYDETYNDVIGKFQFKRLLNT